MELILIAPEHIVIMACAALTVFIVAAMNFSVAWNRRRRWLLQNGRVEVSGCLEQEHLPELYARNAVISAPKYPVGAASIMAASAAFACIAVYCLLPYFPHHP